MSKTFLETFNIHKGAYDKIKDHIGENDLGFATDKGLPVPTQDDVNKLLVVGADGNYRLATKQLSRNYVYSTQASFINCIKYEQVDNTYKLTRIKNEQTTLDQDIQYFELGANFYIAEKEVPDYWLASKEITLGEGETFSPLLFFQELETKYTSPIKFFTGVSLEGREWVDGELIYCTEDSTNYKKGGYYYYNGTVHKVATDKDVNTKLDKSEFNTFKDNLNSILENVQPSAIVDVEQLPGSYTGTALKEGSTVVYFNTSAPYEQIYSWVSSQTGWINAGDYEVILLGAIKIGTDYIPGLMLMRVYAENSYLYVLAAMEIPLWVDEVAAKFIATGLGTIYNKGWNLDIATSMSGVSFTPFDLTPFGASVTTTDGTNDYTNTYNSLSWLVSSTEFTLTGDVNENVLYRLKSNTVSNKYIGTTIRNIGLFEKIYFNTEMPNEEVYALLSSLTTYADNDTGDTYIILAAGPNSTTNYQLLSIWGGHVLMLADKNEPSKSRIVWVSPQYIAANNITEISAGWQGVKSPSMYLFATDSVTVTLQGGSTTTVSVGTENEKINSLVSWSPFVSIPGEPKYELYYYKDKYIKLLQEGDTSAPDKIERLSVSSNSLSEFIKVNDGEYTVTITSEIYDKFAKGEKTHLYVDYDFSSVPELTSDVDLHVYVLFKLTGSVVADSTFDGVVFSGTSPAGTSFTLRFTPTALTASSVTTTVVPGVVKDISYDSSKITVTKYSETDPGLTSIGLEIPVATTIGPNGTALVTSEAVYTALQSYAKKTEVNQMIADYIDANFENGNEGEY